jgi:hypothetical protein
MSNNIEGKKSVSENLIFREDHRPNERRRERRVTMLPSSLKQSMLVRRGLNVHQEDRSDWDG